MKKDEDSSDEDEKSLFPDTQIKLDLSGPRCVKLLYTVNL